MDEVKPMDLFGNGEAADFCREETVAEEEASYESGCEAEEAVCEEQTECTDNSADEAVCCEQAENADSSAETVQNIEALCIQLNERVAGLEQLFSKRIMHAEYEDRIIDRLHNELQKYKEDLYAQLIKPILLDIIDIRNSISTMTAAYGKKPEGEQAIPLDTFSSYLFDLQDILEKNEVQVFSSESGTAYTPIKQKVIRKVSTNDESLHGKIAESMASGYIYKDRVISAEKVTIYFYEKETSTESEEKSNG